MEGAACEPLLDNLTTEEMMAKGIRNVNIIGNLWPVCETCKHIAQSHDDAGCSEMTRGKCPACGNWGQKVPCSCEAYKGPTLEEFIKNYLTPEEAEYYSKEWRVPNAQLDK